MEQVKSFSGEQLTQEVSLLGIFNLPAIGFLSFRIRHTVHHRGQLSTYLRPMGSKVPQIYGGSADNPMEITRLLTIRKKDETAPENLFRTRLILTISLETFWPVLSWRRTRMKDCEFIESPFPPADVPFGICTLECRCSSWRREEGLVQKEGEDVLEIGPGDAVHIAAGEKHWHGACPDESMSHLAVNIGGSAEWMEKVDRRVPSIFTGGLERLKPGRSPPQHNKMNIIRVLATVDIGNN